MGWETDGRAPPSGWGQMEGEIPPSPKRTLTDSLSGDANATPVEATTSSVKDTCETWLWARLPMFPPRQWLLHYSWSSDLLLDTVAGITVGMMLVPQSLAYALLAGLHPITGLYASVLPVFVYALFGTSRQLGIGPQALVSSMVGSTILTLAPKGSDNATKEAWAMLLCGMMGLLLTVMGFFRAGALVNFLSRPLLSAFMSAAAILIILSEASTVLGIEVSRPVALPLRAAALCVDESCSM